MDHQVIIEARNITKDYPGTRALDQVDFQLRQGEVHALCGENGAGKSTLMQILAGVLQPTKGELIFKGKAIRLENPLNAQKLGISTVFQELSPTLNMSVAENVFMNSQPVNRFGFVNFKEMYLETVEALKSFGLNIDPQKPLFNFNVATQQIIEIVRAVHRNAEIVILDEPTSAIGEKEIEELYRIVELLKSNGVSVVYVSHKLDEVFKISDRISILKDGCMIKTLNTGETDQAEVVKYMVGREIKQSANKPKKSTGSDSVLAIKNLSGKGFSNVSLKAEAGEILCMYGLTGSGRSELFRGLFGADPITAGKVTLDNEELSIKSSYDAIKKRITYITENRKEDGLFLEMPIKENISAASLEKLSGMVFMNRHQEKKVAGSFMKKLSIKAPSINQKVSGLSGGNQQKVLFAKWLATKPKVLIADEPTRGIDIAAKAEVHALLRELADNQTIVIVISSELPEVMALGSKVAVMKQGKLEVVLAGADINEEKIGSAALSTV